MEIGTGTAGGIVIDSIGNPHVVYTTSDGKIGYTMHNGIGWDNEPQIESNYGGVCYWPSIDIDSSNNPRIIYVDTMGDTAGTQNQPDVMYAYMNDGVFAKQLLFSGSYDSSLKQGTYPGEKPPQIAMDDNNNLYIFHQWRTYDHGMSVYHDRSLTVAGTTGVSLGSVGSNTDRFDIFGLTESNGKLYALYRNDTNILLSEIGMNVAGEVSGNNTILTFAADSAYSFKANGDDVVIGSKDGDNLRVHYNGDVTTYNDITVAGNAVSIVNLGGTFYAYYSDSDDDNIIKRVQTNDL